MYGYIIFVMEDQIGEKDKTLKDQKARIEEFEEQRRLVRFCSNFDFQINLLFIII